MKESKIRGVVVGLATTDTWNTHQLRWFRVTLKADIEDIADDRKVTQTNMDILIDDPAVLPQLGDLVILTVQVVPLVDEEPPPEVEEIVQFGDEVALADPVDDEDHQDTHMSNLDAIEGHPDYEAIKQGGSE